MSSAGQENDYFKSYVDAEVHKLMLRDRPRTDAYQSAISLNADKIKDKIVLDVGAGSGILALFCWKAGARKVYAVEASDMADVLKEIVRVNGAEDIIEVLHGKAEELELPSKVDVIISEWMGFYLLHESMLNSVIAARDKHLLEGGIVLPSHARIWASPCSLTDEMKTDLDFWSDVYGFNMTPMRDLSAAALKPEVKVVLPEQLLSAPQLVLELDLATCNTEELLAVKKRSFVSISNDGLLQGISLWFDCEFNPGANCAWSHPVSLSTSPRAAPTHWKQTLIVLPTAIEVEADDIFGWDLALTASDSNPRNYKISLEILDPEDEHPVPCDCQWAKCLLIQALLKQDEESSAQ